MELTRRTASPALRTLPAVAALLLLAGCQSQPTRDPEFRTARPVVPRTVPAAPGSLYRVGYGGGGGLFEDLSARRVGDILSIRLVEQTDATKTAETSTSREQDSSVTNPTLLGSALQFNAPGFVPLASNVENSVETSIDSTHEFDGKGESKQSNKLSGEIAVTVAEVLPNGNLVVRGEKLMTLNQGHEHVRFSGVVRAVDIEPDNSVPSTKVAAARIVYGGEGQISGANTAGWLARFFMSAVMPF